MADDGYSLTLAAFVLVWVLVWRVRSSHGQGTSIPGFPFRHANTLRRAEAETGNVWIGTDEEGRARELGCVCACVFCSVWEDGSEGRTIVVQVMHESLSACLVNSVIVIGVQI